MNSFIILIIGALGIAFLTFLWRTKELPSKLVVFFGGSTSFRASE